MKIPSDALHREWFYKDLILKCQVSLEERKSDYSSLRSWFLFGNGPNDAPALFNKIFPHIDQLTSFLYSATGRETVFGDLKFVRFFFIKIFCAV